MTYRGLRNIATTLRMRSGQNDLQIRPRTIWRDKNECTKGTDCDQSQQREYSKQNRPHGGLHKVGDPVPPVRTRAQRLQMLMKVNRSRSLNVIEGPAAISPAAFALSNTLRARPIRQNGGPGLAF
jgi:hypothetical protein